MAPPDISSRRQVIEGNAPMAEPKKPQSKLGMERVKAARDLAEARGLKWNELSQDERKALRLEVIPPKRLGATSSVTAALQSELAQLEARLKGAEVRFADDIAAIKGDLSFLKAKAGLTG